MSAAIGIENEVLVEVAHRNIDGLNGDILSLQIIGLGVARHSIESDGRATGERQPERGGRVARVSRNRIVCGVIRQLARDDEDIEP